MSWKTNRRTKQPFRNPLGNDLDRGGSKVEEEEPSDVQDNTPDDFYTCAICGEQKRKSETPYVMNPSGSPACQDCLHDFQSGRMASEEAYERGRQYTAPVVDSFSDNRHTHKGTCPGCGSTRRSLCPQHSLCFNCDKPGCPRSH